MDVHARVMGGTRCGPASSDGRNVTNDVLLGSCLLGGEVCLMLVYWGKFSTQWFRSENSGSIGEDYIPIVLIHISALYLSLSPLIPIFSRFVIHRLLFL